MPCNLNFNQCNSFINFPQPIFNCRCKLISLLNSSTTTVINPTTSAFASFVATAQTIASQGNLVVSLASSFGNLITTDNSGNITLPRGKYLIVATINGVIPTDGLASFALYKDGSQIASSVSETNGTSGENFTTTLSNVISVTDSSDVISLRNTNSVNQTVNNATIFIQLL